MADTDGNPDTEAPPPDDPWISRIGTVGARPDARRAYAVDAQPGAWSNRHDLNFGPAGVLANPHALLSTPNPATAKFRPVALGARHQVGTFFETDGAGVTHPAPTCLWEAPISSPLPEDTSFLPR